VYVDDIIVTGSNEDNIELIKRKLRNKFDIKDLDFLKYFLGIEITHSHENLFLSQRKYVLDLLKKIRKIGCKPSSTPIDSKNKLNSEEGESLDNKNQYQRLIGKLIYLTVIRPDISFAVSQIMHAPRTIHLEVVNKILRYLKKILRKGILMKNNNTNEICGYSDANWAGSFDRKSITDYCTFVGGNIVTWKNKK
jgi:Reverse transcriptase (RNA-dependent DNA polymerase)